MGRTAAEWLGLYTLDMHAVARALAGAVLKEFDGVPLEETGTLQLLRTRYMRLVADYGLPTRACNDVAARAWKILRQTLDTVDAAPAADFSFYE